MSKGAFGPKRVFAIGAHPDDIEFMMAGTLILLREAGWSLHYMNIANGSRGTATETAETVIAKRRAEAKDACRLIGARHYESICDDMEIYHTTEIVAKVVSVIRHIRPRIMLVLSPQDYMEDHMNAARVAVTAAFARVLRNHPSIPHIDPIDDDVTIYHALPYGLRGPLRECIHSGQYVDITAVKDEKRAMLACHRSQKEWLEKTQGLDAYLDTMEAFAREVGKMSARFEFAEGWRRRLHLGFSRRDSDPLSAALGQKCVVNQDYERALEEG